MMMFLFRMPLGSTFAARALSFVVRMTSRNRTELDGAHQEDARPGADAEDQTVETTGGAEGETGNGESRETGSVPGEAVSDVPPESAVPLESGGTPGPDSAVGPRTPPRTLEDILRRLLSEVVTLTQEGSRSLGANTSRLQQLAESVQSLSDGIPYQVDEGGRARSGILDAVRSLHWQFAPAQRERDTVRHL